MRLLEALLLCLALNCCGEPQPVVYMSVTSAPAEVRSLRVTATLAGAPMSDSSMEFNQDLAEFSIRLPRGARGGLVAEVAGLTTDRCVVARGQGDVLIDRAQLYRVTVVLRAAEFPACPDLRVVTDGEGDGGVRSEPAGIACGATCSARFPPGTRVRLWPEADRRSYFDGWSGGCVGSSPCEIEIGQEVFQVRARFRQQVCSPSGWCWEDPLPQGNVLSGVWGSGPTDVYVVGQAGTILHHDGLSWTAMASGTRSRLSSIWGTGPGQLFVAGGDGRSGVVLRGDGRTWQPVYTPPQDLKRVVGVGDKEVYALSTNHLHRFDGTRWTASALMHGGSQLNAVALWASGPRDVWLSGWGRANAGVILRGDGQIFQDSSSWPREAYDLWGSTPERLFAVSNAGTILSFDGQAWNWMNTRVEEDLYSIRGTGGDEVIAVGAQGRALRFDGQSWQPMVTGTDANLVAVWGSDPEHTFAVGNEGMILQRRGAGWSPIGRQATHAPSMLSSSGPYNVVIISKDRSLFLSDHVVRWDGAYFHDLGDTGARLIHAVWTGGPDAIVVFGRDGDLKRGMLSRWDGKTWQFLPSFTTRILTGVWGGGVNDLFVVSDDGAAQRWDGAAWQPAASPGCALHAVFRRGPDEVYGVCGSSGSIWNGRSWSSTQQAGATLRGIWAAGQGRVFLVGDQGTFLRQDGMVLRSLGCPITEDLLTVWGSSELNVYAAGKGGVLLRWDGARCEVLDSGTSAEIRSLWGSSANEIFAATAGGILRYRP